GIGIAQDQMDKLFLPFSQIDSALSRSYDGTGLGLAISKKLVEMMGGRIWVESEEGVGSTFHFTIKAEAAPAPTPEPEELPAGPQPHLSGKHVLIVDDSRAIRKILSHQAYSWGMIPMIAASGREALSQIQAGGAFDIAILDMNLPDMNGITLAKEIRTYRRSLPLVALASMGHGQPSELFAASLTKPIKPVQLYDTLTGVLAGQAVQMQDQAKTADKISVSQNSLRILLAEDNVSSQKVALKMLEKLGYRADLAANGVEVLEAVKRQPYDLVLMDIKMPEMNGLEAARAIRSMSGILQPKIIAITAYALAGDREKCLEAGMDGYIPKPVQIGDLKTTLEAARPTTPTIIPADDLKE
ncbi:MAG TPA: response regulator, partial [Methanotrichaceae archaeon]|nr:response regulator [Methanotrichaceae archaeon]